EVNFAERFVQMKKIVENTNSQYLQVIQQFKLENHQALEAKLQETMKQGGEGLMLHKINSFYQANRNDNALKYKTYEDQEAKVISYIMGKGKFEGVIGAIIVENQEGIRFKIGSGFSYEQRKNPPKIGSIITYKFYGKTKNNKPKFASFLRVRKEY
ncbi:MAG: DNA ligase, partial [Pelagibacterales bacterium]|nr:DNA ligase [Pelagibacterales bacterium]